ncbi:MAG: class I SAM-dependent methyltransferase [Candidatus Woesearchaeota archaeon]|jgi:ubiquinone/menaquinone biosynthesis C-methylase UbiE
MLKSHYQEIAKNQDNHWWYRGMTVINLSLLDYYLAKKRNLKILDAGCGPGVMLPHLKKYGDVLGVDLSTDALKFAEKRGIVKKADITNLKTKDNTYDLIICMDVMYHTWVKDVNKALVEFKRVLKKGGMLLIREPAYNWMRGNEDRGSLTARRFSKGDLEKSLIKNGFKVKKISYVNFFLFPIVFAVRIYGMITNKKGSSDLLIPSSLINNLLFLNLKIESYIIKYVSLPFGSSLICVTIKK